MFDINRMFSVFPPVVSLEAYSHPLGTGCPSEQNSNNQEVSTVGSLATSLALLQQKLIRKFHLKLSLSGPAPTPQGDGVRPSQAILEPCSPCLPFLQHVHPLRPLPGFRMCLPIRDPSRTAQYLSALGLLEKIHQLAHYFFQTWAALP